MNNNDYKDIDISVLTDEEQEQIIKNTRKAAFSGGHIFSKLIDNRKNGKVIDEIIYNTYRESEIDFISENISMYGIYDIRRKIEDSSRTRIIINSLLNDEGKIDESKLSKIFGNEKELAVKNSLIQSSVAKSVSSVIERIDIKAIKENESKVSSLMNIRKDEDHTSIHGTLGLTLDGLGIIESDDLALNTSIYGKDFTKEYNDYFENIWSSDICVDVKEEVINALENLSKENSAELIYYFTLYNIFHKYNDNLESLDTLDESIGFKKTKVWNMLFDFQEDGVVGAINKLENFGGCIIADSVGLGKTFSALAIIKYYELRNKRVLVLVPKKLRGNWTAFKGNTKSNILLEDDFRYDVLNHTDLSRETGKTEEIDLGTLNWGNYDLVVIDESHNFRNNNPSKGRKSRYEKLLEDIVKDGVDTKVLMLSATPVNNNLSDLRNQFKLITEGDNSILREYGIHDIDNVLKKAEYIFRKWSELPSKGRTISTFINMMDIRYFKLLDLLTIARSRKHIEQYYDLEKIGSFPEKLKPKNIYSKIDESGNFPEISEVNKIISSLNLAIYSPFKYIKKGKENHYEKMYPTKGKGKIFKQRDRENALVGLMRIGLLKRLESSIYSFKESSIRMLELNRAMCEKLSSGLEADFDNDIENYDFDDELPEENSIGNKIKILINHLDVEAYKKALEEDIDKLEDICSLCKGVSKSSDLKLKKLNNEILSKIKNPINPNNKKVVVFTAYADTAIYIYETIKDELINKGLNIAIVTGGKKVQTNIGSDKLVGKRHDINTILTHFSPKSKNMEGEVKEEIDILIATDCISEGQNLQDCDYLINYDIHWNPVRIIQRFGRIDRIGSQNSKIQLINFWPTEDLDEYINLESRVKNRMALVGLSSAGEDDILEDSNDDNDKKEQADLKYRRSQLEKMMNENISIEDATEAISMTDLTLNDFRVELMNYMKGNSELLETTPNGVFSAVEIPEDMRGIIQPGVIFSILQKKGEVFNLEKNPLYPIYLVYIDQNGNILYEGIESKMNLDRFRKVAVGRAEVDKKSYQRLSKETDDYTDMSKFSNMLSDIVAKIESNKEKSSISSLFTRGGTDLLKEIPDKIEDFEILSYLVLYDV